MNKFAYLLVAIIAFFAGAVSASVLNGNDITPSKNKVISYFEQAHIQQQTY
ncbi:hypothetical protein G6708_06155 [Polynucleobacter paneuropaeus]|jgi:hypothetical protein|uniref:Uncharacterized protein n=1 Tax=Polynucleobacter paneuropaeus TaxID=2527775 RepID=A0A9Q2WIY3_9BURK|nr:hypothetical protein [Polynucleobacter paneuropaeus]MBT8515563.1 hypothetical protein [Polynucleobacter paneuropaeus]MBT8517483.1 hypothetical protein [Polynucleobacter paneuropaeus]MBT8520357.1 hypothetical protein [Polynucleobacter paneuropaeus]MBT8521725.1 hypothetical protein [Polynucleobacter paneuropaeus]MBT8523250.1 hypothetical protein [Polynucleobacter paneuropaeus]